MQLTKQTQQPQFAGNATGNDKHDTRVIRGVSTAHSRKDISSMRDCKNSHHLLRSQFQHVSSGIKPGNTPVCIREGNQALREKAVQRREDQNAEDIHQHMECARKARKACGNKQTPQIAYGNSDVYSVSLGCCDYASACFFFGV